MYARNSHSYTHLILALGIVREPTIWAFITVKYPGIHDIGWANVIRAQAVTRQPLMRSVMRQSVMRLFIPPLQKPLHLAFQILRVSAGGVMVVGYR